MNISDASENYDWDYLLRRISEKRCTPFIGPGASYGLLHSAGEMARLWARQYDYPLEDSHDLARVAQFASMEFGDSNLKTQLREQFGQRLIQAEQSSPSGIYEVMAGLRLPLYITTNYDSLIEHALGRAGREADWRVCAWNRKLRRLPEAGETTPSVTRPLVFHLHGHVASPDSLVLTEDDYADFLSSVSRDDLLLPPRIQGAIADNTLLFLGYRLDDWRFRLLFRWLVTFLQRSLAHSHFAVASGSSENYDHSSVEMGSRERLYLMKYLEAFNISVYWGSHEEFANELSKRWRSFDNGR